ncbi:MAG: carbonate dehydratase [Robiginitomaculum sp.]|nr:MAG: carbonate dehydratase [Robiginitomaculum sp.]
MCVTNQLQIPSWKQDLISGYQEFRSGAYKTQRGEYARLGTDGQNPEIMMVACADSRVNPSAIFHAHPGELFTLRNVANIVPPFENEKGLHGASAAIEYAVLSLKVKAIVVMGHESCGGIQCYLEGEQELADTDFIGEWIQLLSDAHGRLTEAERAPAVAQTNLEYAGILQSLENLMTFPFVAKAVQAGELSLLGAYFSIIQGKLLFADENGIFQEISSEKIGL